MTARIDTAAHPKVSIHASRTGPQPVLLGARQQLVKQIRDDLEAGISTAPRHGGTQRAGEPRDPDDMLRQLQAVGQTTGASKADSMRRASVAPRGHHQTQE